MHKTQTAERRRNYRIPARMELNFRDIKDNHVCRASSIDLTPFGAQIESETSMQQERQIELWPVNDDNDRERAVKGRVKWVKSHNGKFISGIAFENEADWAVNLSSIGHGSMLGEMSIQLLNAVLKGVEDGVIIVDADMKILAANPAQPFFPHMDHHELVGHSLEQISDFLDISTPDGTIRHIIQTVVETGEEKTVNLSGENECPNDLFKKYNFFIRSTLLPGDLPGVIIRAHDTKQLRELHKEIENQEENLWLQYQYITLGQLFDGLIEDIVNPISAAVGRLDLMDIKLKSMDREKSKASLPELQALQTEVNTIQSILMQVTEFCRAAIRRRKDTSGTLKLFSINTLIDDELGTLELHSQFKNIKKKLFLSRNLPLIEGDYSDWVNAFVALCQAMLRRVSTLQHKELIIKTYDEEGMNVLSFTHNGKALPLPLEKDPGLTILKLLQKKYGATITVRGSSGNQTVSIKIKPGRKIASASKKGAKIHTDTHTGRPQKQKHRQKHR